MFAQATKSELRSYPCAWNKPSRPLACRLEVPGGCSLPGKSVPALHVTAWGGDEKWRHNEINVQLPPKGRRLRNGGTFFRPAPKDAAAVESERRALKPDQAINTTRQRPRSGNDRRDQAIPRRLVGWGRGGFFESTKNNDPKRCAATGRASGGKVLMAGRLIARLTGLGWTNEAAKA